jgi:hypothetical protein
LWRRFTDAREGRVWGRLERPEGRQVDGGYRQRGPLNCIGLKQQPDYAREPCRNYHTLVNERNDLLHGNVVVDKLKFNEVYFLGQVRPSRNTDRFGSAHYQVEIDTVGLQAVHSELATVDGLIAHLMSCLDDELREPVQHIVNRHELGRNEQTGRTE